MKRFIFFSLSVLLPGLFIQGQGYRPGIPFIHSFTGKDFHQVSNQNWDLVQDSRGFLYFANDYGVLEYDGADWTIIQTPPNHSITRALAFGPEKRLYVGAQDFFGYVEFDRYSQHGLRICSLSDSLPPAERNFGNVWKIISHKGAVYFFTWKALYRYTQTGLTTIKGADPFKSFFLLDDKIYLQGSKGLFEWDHALALLPNTSFFNQQTIAFIAPYSSNALLIGSQEQGFFLYRQGKISPFRLSDQALLLNAKLECGIVLRNGLFLAGTSENGLILFDRNGQILLHLNRQNGLGHSRIRKIMEDNDGNWWVLNEKGIDVVEASSPFVRVIIDAENAYPVYTSFIFNHTLYIGSHAGLFYTSFHSLFSPEFHQTFFQKVNHASELCWKLDTIKNRLYLCSGDGIYEISGNQAHRIYSESGAWAFLRPSRKPGFVVAGTYNGLVLFSIEKSGLKFRKKPDGFSETSRIMAEDNEGNIWVSHGYKGVFKITLNQAYDSILSVKFYNRKKGFPTDIFINVFKINNDLLFGTQKGIYGYDEKKDTMVPDQRFNALFGRDAQVKYLITDQKKRIWFNVGETTGLLIPLGSDNYSMEKYPFQKMAQEYIPGFENFFFLDNGDALLGTRNGLIYYDQGIPVSPKQNYEAIILRAVNPSDLSQVYFEQRDYFFGKQAKEISINIPYHRNSIRFEFTSCFYEDPDQTSFSYYLEGYDDTWSEWTQSHFKEFTNLHEGKYVFHVKAKNIYEEESKDAVFRFTVMPPWYRTWLALILFGALIIGGLWLVFRYRTRRFEEEKTRLIEEQEQKRRLEQIQYNEEKLITTLDNKNKELMASTMKVLYKNEKLLEIKKLIEAIKSESKEDLDRKVSLIMQFIDKELKDDEWDDFEMLFDQAHNNFIKHLRQKYPDLSTRDLKICAYLRMNMSTKEIAQILNMTVRGVETARFRIRKRMGLEPADNLNEFIIDL